MPTSSVRLMYETAVTALRDAASERLREGASEEDVARWAVKERNALKQEYRDHTPAPILTRIVAKTQARYGNSMGPTADQLRAAGKSWKEIIDSATRAGDHGAAFFGQD
ncbi:MAG: hemagglutinin [Ottowia sp.]|uniref:hemagglutinin n=2 Tax=unclassified Ottowia TaxID=2645081 RepID=UPI003C76745F